MTSSSRPGVPPPARQGGNPRLAFCPLCGAEQSGKPVSTVSKPEQALCPGRCTIAWSVLSELRASESASRLVAERRRLESEAQAAHAPALSEVLLERWREGDWRVDPTLVARRLPPAGAA